MKKLSKVMGKTDTHEVGSINLDGDDEVAASGVVV